MYLEVDLSVKSLFTKGVYIVQGRLNAFNVNTQGYFNNSMGKCLVVRRVTCNYKTSYLNIMI